MKKGDYLDLVIIPQMYSLSHTSIFVAKMDVPTTDSPSNKPVLITKKKCSEEFLKSRIFTHK